MKLTKEAKKALEPIRYVDKHTLLSWRGIKDENYGNMIEALFSAPEEEKSGYLFADYFDTIQKNSEKYDELWTKYIRLSLEYKEDTEKLEQENKELKKRLAKYEEFEVDVIRGDE